MKKLIAIICVLLVIFVGMVIYRRSNINSNNVTASEVGQIEEYITKPAKVKILKTDEEKNESRLEITIHEGKNRQVRKMCEAINHKVLALHRSKIAGIGVKDLQLGKWRYLTSKEVEKIIKSN